ncbi:threonine ammonia-lyase, biosynthetic [Candidatus Pseudothioglobus sp. Uisw_050_01]|uniref:threonine ammonia-lyase, biosynthetic n=1 Tax=Candidatus Pseudothioglobus sp. Uisw_050_01 TaxID=3230997 RepID=UPI003A8B0ED0
MSAIVKLADNSSVYEVAKVSPLSIATQLSKKFANQVYLKREDDQIIHSFKLRGAYQKMSSMSDEQKAKGVIASSAGNHAQGVALGASKLSIKATIVMPTSTPQIKVRAVQELGAEVILFGDVYDDAFVHAKKLVSEKDLCFISPYDDFEVIAGQATVAKEILAQLDQIDYVFSPIGGGGLISGMASYIKHYAPHIKVIGVEPIDSPTLFKALEANERVVLDDVGRFADGVAVKQIGELPFEIAKECVDDVILVSNDEMCAAIKDIYEDVRSISEPAGALATAGVKKYILEHGLKNKNIVSIVSGSNVNFDRLRYIAERADLGEVNEAIVAVTIPEEPGSFLRFCELLDNNAVTEFNYRYSAKKDAHIFVGVKLTKGESEKQALIARLSNSFEVFDMSDNSMAITHIRYMVGGHANAENEVIYRFEFPERPGALLSFLKKVKTEWNISLFHYRNHGADYGRVLIGLQVEDIKELESKFDELGYYYKNETDNKAYQYFL